VFEYVKDLGLVPTRPYKKREKTDLIILHHFESNASAQAVHAYHISRGHKGIDYNIVVLKNGDVVWGRGLEFEGGHTSNTAPRTKGVNARSVGIAAQGNFNLEKMETAQKEALKRIVADVVMCYGLTSTKQIITHKEIAGTDYTDCPGTYYPADEIREYIRTYKPPIIDEPEKPIEELPENEEPAEELPAEEPKKGPLVIDNLTDEEKKRALIEDGAQRQDN